MKTFRTAALTALLALAAALAPAATAHAQQARQTAAPARTTGGAARPARASNRPLSARAQAHRAAKRELLSKGKGFVRNRHSRWLPAEKLKGMNPAGGMRLRALGRARLVTVYVPETQGGVAGFRVESLYGVAQGEFDRSGGAGEILSRVETAYGTAIATVSSQHITKPTPTDLHQQAVRDIEAADSADDPVVTGRRGIAATVGGRDRWTRYQAPSEYEQTTARSNRPPTQSVATRRTADGYAVVSLSSFTKGIAEQIGKDLTGNRPRGVVLDLRGNGGGLVAEARQLLELFAADNRVIAIDRERMNGAEKVQEWRADKKGPLAGMPLVVLVDGNTASASETVTASLKDTGYARVAGTRTFGKAVKQLPTKLEDGSGIRVTMGWIEGPRTKWQDRGIDPDVSESSLAEIGRRALGAGRDRDVAGAHPGQAGDAVLVGALQEVRSLARTGLGGTRQ